MVTQALMKMTKQLKKLNQTCLGQEEDIRNLRSEIYKLKEVKRNRDSEIRPILTGEIQTMKDDLVKAIKEYFQNHKRPMQYTWIARQYGKRARRLGGYVPLPCGARAFLLHHPTASQSNANRDSDWDNVMTWLNTADAT